MMMSWRPSKETSVSWISCIIRYMYSLTLEYVQWRRKAFQVGGLVQPVIMGVKWPNRTKRVKMFALRRRWVPGSVLVALWVMYVWVLLGKNSRFLQRKVGGLNPSTASIGGAIAPLAPPPPPPPPQFCHPWQSWCCVHIQIHQHYVNGSYIGGGKEPDRNLAMVGNQKPRSQWRNQGVDRDPIAKPIFHPVSCEHSWVRHHC